MNKLVSKNPVQRFKEGKKIEKFQGGASVPKFSPGNREFVPQYQKDVTHFWLEGLRNKYVRPFQKTTVIPQQQTQTRKTTLKKDSITPSVFAGHRIGKTGGLNYNINDSDKQQLIGTGQFTESDFTNARATQQALNRYFANSGLGSVKENNAWGDQSRAALALALSKSKSLTPFSNETTVIRTPIIPTYTPTTPINQEVANLKLNVPQQTYDRTGIREYLRSKGLNPYSFSGAQRRALRMVMNGQGTDNDKLLVKGMNIFKQGGLLLPSRNPVIRFRNRNFK